jgi:hypothetical protein
MSQPATQEKKKGSRGRIRVETGTKRIRAFLGGVAVADTSRPLLVWEKPYYPAYYFPAADVRMGMRVEVVWADEPAPTVESIRYFRPAAGNGASDDGSATHA